MTDQRLLILFFFALISTITAQYSCPSPQQPSDFCSAIILYVIDASTDLPYSEASAEFNFSRYNILPFTNWHNSIYVAFFVYGSGAETDFVPTNDFGTACGQLSSLQHMYDQFGSNSASLYQTMIAINNHYGLWLTSVVLFSGSKDTADIQNAGSYIRSNMREADFTVVALNEAMFDGNNFPGTIYNVWDLNYPPSNLAGCVLGSTCRSYDPNCNINQTSASSTITTIRSTTTSTPRPTTSSTPTTRTTPTTTSTPTSTPSSSSSTLECQCDTMSAWVDMIFAIDASASTGSTGLNEMWGMAATMLTLFNVQKSGYTATNYTSRVGIITYGNTANVLYPLGSLDNDDIDNLFDLPFNNDPMANLEAGIQAAVEQFNGPNHRSNARKVLIIMAAVFNPDGENSPNKTAETFKEEDGVIIVFNYVPAHGIESPMLAVLSSPGYYFSTKLNSHYTDIALGMCDANCFCRNNLHPYGLSSPRKYPTKGCYISVSAESNYARAKNNCKVSYYNGYVAVDEDAAKTTFLKTLLPSNSFYIGLTYDNVTRRWEWPDGSPTGSYQPWYGGKVPDPGSSTCVFVDSNSQWQQTDCRNGYYYICETMPCDSEHYCA